ncbi:MAG: sugar phosphate nucleotidyltransferase [Syntrophomonadaceae bacterium]|nr:sugar phosphate nucleotidyltransferase [Syntrophomonadaceae bacterium]
MISVILAGGKGLRLWPTSRRQRPKQLCNFVGNRSMLNQTIDRLISIGSERVIIITGDDLFTAIEQEIARRNDAQMITVLSEPEGKNTAPAVGLALASCVDDVGDQIMGIFPADHHILDNHAFKNSIQRAMLAAQQNHIATIGINPDRPETGYGYIEKTRWEFGSLPDVYGVNSFCEKPDMDTATQYVNGGEHMWNAGIYISRASVLLDEFKQHLPEIYTQITSGLQNYIYSYSSLPDISLDYGLAEKCSRMAVVPSDFGWCDLGSWNALPEVFPADADHNVCCGEDLVAVESSGCVVKQVEKSIVLFGVENLLVVETDDIVFVADRNRAQDIRQVVDRLSLLNRHDLL